MELNKKRQQKLADILELKIAITDAIDKIAKDGGYKTTYAEINSALSQVLKSNIDYELREEIDMDSI